MFCVECKNRFQCPFKNRDFGGGVYRLKEHDMQRQSGFEFFITLERSVRADLGEATKAPRWLCIKDGWVDMNNVLSVIPSCDAARDMLNELVELNQPEDLE